MILILKIMLVFIILSAMAMILMGVNQLFSSHSDVEEKDLAELRSAVNEKEDVMTPQNVFRRFLDR